MYELEINEENIKQTLIEDVLKRNGCIYNFLKLLYTQDSKATISIDGEWGTGKTFFVKQLEYVINLLNEEDNIKYDQEIYKIVINFINKLNDLEINTYGNTRAIYYNACEYDYFEEPILTIIADIIKNNPNIEISNTEVKENLGEKIDKFISSFKISASIQTHSNNLIGVEFQKDRSEHETSFIEKILLDKELEKNFKLLLEELLVEKSNKMVIFIDELDRCNPKFAVKLLEKIKFFFNDNRFIFVFSTNLNQLQHTIEKYYGTNFNGAYYLQKFFDYQLELPEIEIEDYVKSSINLIDIYSLDYFDNAIMDAIKYMKFQLRDCNKYFELLKLRYSKLKKINLNPSTIFFFHILFPLLLAVKIKDFNMYLKIKHGNGAKEFYNLVIHNKSAKEMLSKFFKENLDIHINSIYNYIYVNQAKELKLIGNDLKLSLNKNIVNELEYLLSYLGEKVIL